MIEQRRDVLLNKEEKILYLSMNVSMYKKIQKYENIKLQKHTNTKAQNTKIQSSSKKANWAQCRGHRCS